MSWVVNFRFTFNGGMASAFRFSAGKSASSGTAHQCGGMSAINNWLNAQKPHGIHAGRHTNHSISFWYVPNSPICGNSSSRSRDGSCRIRLKWCRYNMGGYIIIILWKLHCFVRFEFERNDKCIYIIYIQWDIFRKICQNFVCNIGK